MGEHRLLARTPVAVGVGLWVYFCVLECSAVQCRAVRAKRELVTMRVLIIIIRAKLVNIQSSFWIGAPFCAPAHTACRLPRTRSASVPPQSHTAKQPVSHPSDTIAGKVQVNLVHCYANTVNGFVF